MKRSELVALAALLIAAIWGVSFIGLCEDEAMNDACKCFKMTYTTADGRNMTVDFYNQSCAGMCNENNTQMLYLDSAGTCTINGVHSPFCLCGPNCPVGCTCLQNLTMDFVVTTLQSMM
ncbi:MAG TPA: hypothetical protein PLS48_11920 [Methanotrichaceae archaeon]|nr:hypothetical protein [Methanotrichaceae archaeon]